MRFILTIWSLPSLKRLLHGRSFLGFNAAASEWVFNAHVWGFHSLVEKDWKATTQTKWSLVTIKEAGSHSAIYSRLIRESVLDGLDFRVGRINCLLIFPGCFNLDRVCNHFWWAASNSWKACHNWLNSVPKRFAKQLEKQACDQRQGFWSRLGCEPKTFHQIMVGWHPL